MKQIQFRDYDHYLKAQKLTVAKRGVGPYFCDLEMIRIAEWCKLHNLQVRKGICHGARNGLECDELMRHLPQADIFGTDLFPYSGKSSLTRGKAKVIEWDFFKINNEWKEVFEIVYTNSIDHVFNPEETLKVWLDQLVWNGALFVQWNRADMEVKAGDCFGADPLEMIDLLNAVGKLVDMIYVNVEWQKGHPLRRKGLESIVYVVQKKRG